ncbi:MAG: SDR family oxidoreductase [Sedimentisphaerales bacterium]|nr:SDR family oxidoreductase [Sedimentisphaerales bacterium]
MSIPGSILLTGITGSLGSVLARYMLDEGYTIKALVREQNHEIATVRTKRTLKIIDASYGDNLEVILGDICNKNLGISNQGLSNVSLIIHCAALLDFSDESAQKSNLINVNGTTNVLDLAEKLKTPVCYISTAYVAGKRKGVVREYELNVGQEFHNNYEKSKCCAEKNVQDWSERTGLPVMIFRPSILVGDSQKGKIVSFDGVYNLLKFFDNAADLIKNQEFRAIANPNATKNFIPIDIASKMIWYIIKSNKPGVYHITNPNPISLDKLREIFIELFDIPRARFVDEKDFKRKKASRYELMYKKVSSLYMPYLCEEPIFDRTFTEQVVSGDIFEIPEMNLVFFRKLLNYARKEQWGKYRSETKKQPDIRHTNIVEDYFNRFLADKMHKQLLPDLKNLTANCRISVSEIPSKSWYLEIEKGRLENISLNGMKSQCAYSIDGDTFERIVKGKLAPQQAFFRKKIDIKGNIEIGLKLATVLAAFFRKYPYESGENNG